MTCARAAFLLTAWFSVGCSPPPGIGPHLVLITVDTLRADHVGLYGYGRDTTPSIDRFFADASIFENAMSPSPCTVPAVRQLLYGAFDFVPTRPPLAELLAASGYRTAAVVSQHQFRGPWHSLYARGFDHFDVQGEDEVGRHGFTARSAAEVSDRALDWLAANADAPAFFLWLHYFDPHDPYDPPPEFRNFDRDSRSTRDGDRRAALIRERRSEKEPWTGAGYIFSEEDVAHLLNLYDGEIRHTDFQIGRVLERLRSLDLDERSIVALTSDHGEWLGEEERWDHCMTLRETELRVPMLVRVNGARLADFHRDRIPATTLDLLPTFLGLLGIEVPAADYHGANLLHAHPDRTVSAFWRGARVVRSRSWKLHLGTPVAALYHLEDDPAEEFDRFASESETVRRLAAQAGARAALARSVERETEESAELLKRLGYIE